MSRETDTPLDACPHCGEQRVRMPRFDDGTPEYACGATGNIRTAYCRMSQRVQKAEAEVVSYKKLAIELVQELIQECGDHIHQEQLDELLK